MRINKSALDKLRTKDPGKLVFYRDDALRGFGLKVSPKGTKSFIVERRVNGRTRRVTLGRYPYMTPDEARKAAFTLLAQMSQGIDPVAEKKRAKIKAIVLEDLLDDYFATHVDLSASTINDYRRHLSEAFSDWRTKPITSITKNMVGLRHQQLGLKSHARANNAMRSLRAWLNHAMAKYEDDKGHPIIPVNPVVRLNQTRAWFRVQRKQTWIKPAQLPAWYQATLKLNHTTARDYLHFLLFTGLRKSEATRLAWDDVDFVDRSFVIPETKNRRPHALPMSDFLYQLLMDRKANQKNAYVFPSNLASREHTHLIEPKSAVRKVTSLSGVVFSFHDLRRTFITIAESLDISVYALKRLLNHHVTNDVTEGYIILDIERLREPMQRITDKIQSYLDPDPGDPVIQLDDYRAHHFNKEKA